MLSIKGDLESWGSEDLHCFSLAPAMTTLLKQLIVCLRYCRGHLECFFFLFNPHSKFAIINPKQKLEEVE